MIHVRCAARYTELAFAPLWSCRFSLQRRTQCADTETLKTLSVNSSGRTQNTGDVRREISRIEREVQRAYGQVWHTLTTRQVTAGGKTLWQAEISVTLPRQIHVSATASKKSESEALAEIELYKKLRAMGALEKLLPQTAARAQENFGGGEGSPVSTSMQHNVADTKSTILAVYDNVCRAKNSADFRPQFDTEMNACRQWASRVSVTWPFPMVFDGVGQRKTQAEGQACVPLLDYLSDNGFLDQNLYPKLYTDAARKALKNRRVAPVRVALPASSVAEMEVILQEFESLQGKVKASQEEHSSEDRTQPAMDEGQPLWDIVTGQPLDEALHQAEIEASVPRPRRHGPSPSVRKLRESLPIFEYRQEIVRQIKQNRVVILAGETGSGKTTQVPQYIFEDHGCRSSCNIVVTQPRRLSAISMAERVAWERGERVGETIGYQVRMKREALRRRGGVFFCTTGILLRHLQNNPCFRGISHVIVDEAHERDVNTDFLLILLREAIERNTDLRVVIMSATINTDKFSDYFGGAPILTIPGKLHDVKEYYLEDLLDEQIVHFKDSADPVKLAARVVEYIYYHRAPGAILCFLPGWNEISYVTTELQKLLPPQAHSWVLPLHSKLRHEDQRKIFSSPPSSLENVRKVILATNIAETSITVSDVVYVVDTGLHREQRFDSSLGVPLLDTFETSRSSMRQRRGRAGRLCPGECYFLFKESDALKRPEFCTPEMLRTALATVVLNCKLFCPGAEVEATLSQAPDSPPVETVRKAIKDLQAMGLMNEMRDLTELGKCVGSFPLAPQLAKSLVYATLFRCVKSITSLAALMSDDVDIFCGRLTNTESREVKFALDQSKRSDHVAMMKMYSVWESKTNSVHRSMFCHSHGVSSHELEYSRRLKRDYLHHLVGASLVDCTRDSMENWLHPINAHAKNGTVLAAILTAAFYPNVLRVHLGLLRKGQLLENARELLDLNGRRATLAESSTVYENEEIQEQSFIIYYNAMRHFDGKRIVVHDATQVSALHVLLFAGQSLEILEDVIFSAQREACLETDNKILVIDGERHLAFRCPDKDAHLIARWRNMLLYLLQLHLLPKAVSQSNTHISELRQCMLPGIIRATVDILVAGNTAPTE